jgi:hypothetical protein
MTSIAAYYVLIVTNERDATELALDHPARPTIRQRLRALVAGLRPVKIAPRPT